MYDPELYRSKEEVEEWKKRDPIAMFTGTLRRQGLTTDADLAALETSVAAEVDQAVAVAESGSWEPVEDLLRDVYTPTEPAP
jgi:TPP-dependent pyruvate/acetoin dehydrogenase alpha subunit